MHDVIINGDLLVDIADNDDLVKAQPGKGHEDDELQGFHLVKSFHHTHLILSINDVICVRGEELFHSRIVAFPPETHT